MKMNRRDFTKRALTWGFGMFLSGVGVVLEEYYRKRDATRAEEIKCLRNQIAEAMARSVDWEMDTALSLPSRDDDLWFAAFEDNEGNRGIVGNYYDLDRIDIEGTNEHGETIAWYDGHFYALSHQDVPWRRLSSTEVADWVWRSGDSS